MAIFERKRLFVTPTPWGRVPELTLFEDTWQQHIVTRHPELAGQEAAVLQVASSPTVIIPGNTATSVIFVNPEVTTPGGTPLAVVADEPGGFIRTAYYSRSAVSITPGTELWLSPGKK